LLTCCKSTYTWRGQVCDVPSTTNKKCTSIKPGVIYGDVHVLGLYALSLKKLSSGLAKTFFTKKKHSSIILEAMTSLWGSHFHIFPNNTKNPLFNNISKEYPSLFHVF
jgi:hypothetical protein